MKKVILVLIGFCLIGSSAYGNEIGFIQSAQDVVPNDGRIEIAFGLLDESDWKSKFPNVAYAARPYPGYMDMAQVNPINSSENLEVFRSEASFVVSPAQVNAFLSSGIDFLGLARVIGKGFVVSNIAPEAVNAEYQKTLDESYKSAQQVLTDKRNRASNPISDVQYQQANQKLASLYQSNKQRTWCQLGADSCIQVVANFGELETLMSIGSAIFGDSVPSGVKMYAEMIGVDNPQALSQSPEVAQIPYKPQVMLVLNGVTANKLLQFSRTVVSIHQVDAQKSLVVIQNVTAFEKDDLDKMEKLSGLPGVGSGRELMLGQSPQNRDTGLAKGLPILQYELAQTLKSIFEGASYQEVLRQAGY